MANATCSCRCKDMADDRYDELEKIIEKYKGKQGALMPILNEVQQLFGFLPQRAQSRIAEALGLPESEVFGVATFYSFFTLKPRGKYRIGVCLGTACYVKGAAEVVEALKKELNIDINDTTDDGLFTLDVTRCVGACGLAPVMTVGDDVYGKMTPDKVKEILAKYQ